MDFKNSIGYLLHELAHLINAESNQVLQERLGIGFAQFKVLMVLEERDGVTQKAVAESLKQTEASISRQIKILEQKRLLLSRQSSSNRREHLLYLTDRGIKMVETATSALNSYHAPMFSHLSERNQLKIIDTLQLIRKTIER